MITILGPGALGLALASVLHEGGASVLVLDHDPARAERLTREGVRVSGPGERPERVVRLHVTADPADLRAAEIVLVTVKAHADPEAVRVLAQAPSKATLVALGNGLGRAEALAVLGRERVLAGTTTEGAGLEGEGRVRHSARGRTFVAPLGPEGLTRARETALVLARHGLDAHATEDARQLVWEKVQVNAAINALAALLDVPNGALLESPTARALAQEAAVECGRVASALGVPGAWTADAARARWEAVARATAANFCSTVQDLRRRRKSEIHAINGAVARAAREVGPVDSAAPVTAPLNEHLAALISAREELFGRSP